MADAAPSIACAATTAAKAGNATMVRQPSATSSPEPASSSRFARVPSTSRPAGTWLQAAAIEDTAMTMPIAPAPQCWFCLR